MKSGVLPGLLATLAAGLVAAVPLTAFALQGAGGPDWIRAAANGSFRGGIGLVDGERQTARVEVTGRLDVDFSDRVRLVAVGRAREDSIFDYGASRRRQFDPLAPYSRPRLIGDAAEFDLREAYVRADLGRVRLTLGKQQIVWGVADGFKVLDVVNPQDFREFILEGFDDSRIPLWSVSTEVFLDDFSVQWIWVPDASTHVLPAPDSQFFPRLPGIPAGIPLDYRSGERPSRIVADSDAGIRIRTFQGGWDFSFLYLYRYDDTPAFLNQVEPGPAGPVLVVRPEFRRGHLAGGTFSNAFGSLVFRGEWGLFLKRSYPRRGETYDTSVVETDEVSWVVGFDWTGVTNTFLSFQLFHNGLLTAPARIVRDRHESFATAVMERRWLQDRLKARGTFLFDDNGDRLLRGRLSHDLNDHLTIWTSADVFEGRATGIFGQFDDEDRWLVGLDWFF